MPTFLKSLFYSIGLVLFISCQSESKTESIIEANELRIELSQKDWEDQRNQFNNLSEQMKVYIWTSKMNQILSNSNLPPDLRADVEEIKKHITRLGINASIKTDDEFIKVVKRIHNKTPIDDIAKMFGELDNYSHKVGFSNSPIVAYTDKGINLESNIDSPSTERTCTCRWCLFVAFKTSDCEPTSKGCGWLWQYECNQTYE